LEAVIPEPLPPLPPLPPEVEEEYGNTEIAQLQVLDFSPDNFIEENIEDARPEPEVFPDAALEFTLPPGELDRIFIESSVGIMPPFSSLGSLEPPDGEPPAAAQPTLDVVTFEEFTPLEPPATIELTPPAAEAPAPLEDEEPLPDIEVISDDRLSSAHAQHSPLAELGSFDLSEAPPRSTKSRALWLGAAIVAALLLVGQLLHHNREALTAHGPLAPVLRAVYASIGAPLGATPDLAAFQLRQWGVTGDAAGDATLRVRASILNTTTRMQPFPLLRVTLANRYGTRIGTRDFQPSEYAGQPVARLLSPGEKVDAVLNILDPGKEAEGFEIDVCLPGGDQKIVCANDAAPAQARQ
jgi:hypothetical protein